MACSTLTTRRTQTFNTKLVVGNLVWGIILMETIVMQIYFFGFSIFEPIGTKPPIKGAIASPTAQCPKTVEVKP